MKANSPILPLAGTVLFGGFFLLHAANASASGADRFGLSYRMGLNVSTKFRNVAASAFPHNPSVTGRSYANGFVGTDNTGNAGGVTTFWGYQNAGQAQDANAVLLMRDSASSPSGPEADDDPYHGFELTYDHEMARNGRLRMGIEAAFNWADYSVDQQGTPRRVDAFPLGYTPPQAPYIGTVNSGPFVPLLGTAPTTLMGTVKSKLDASFYGFRLGPYLDLPVSDRVRLTFSAGLLVTVVDGSYDFTESYVTPGGSSVAQSRHASDASPVVGGELGLQGTFKLGNHVNAFTGLEYQGSDSYSLQASDMEAEMNLRAAVFWTCGLSVSF